MPVCSPVRRTFSDEHGPGTFHTLGALPRRKIDSARKSPVFHIAHDDDDEHSSSLDEHLPQPLFIPTTAVPFPRSSSPPSPNTTSSPSPISPCSPLPRGASAPILLANGKPLKSSLKSSPSSPAVSTPPHAPHMHLRSRSEPSTPAATPKNVHFPEKDYGLATVRVFNRSARPAALSNPANGNGDETETEGEETPPTFFPFPPLSSVFNYEIDPTQSSSIPSNVSPCANLLIESLTLPPSSSPSPSATAKPALTGSILVRNLAFEKHVAIRFTLDDWQTVSEVGAHYDNSLSTLPSHILPSSSPSALEDTRARGWDRFNFTIRLEDYAHSLSTRTLWLAARYRTDSTYPEPGSSQCGPGGEWWDNNAGHNYCIGFRPALALPRIRPRRETVSAPIPSYRKQPQPPMTCKEHVLRLMVPSVHKEPVHKDDRHSVPLRAGKLSLCNYAPPAACATTCVSSAVASSQCSSSSSITKPQSPPSVTQRLSSDEETASPASSTLSSPSVSPTIAPRVIIGGQPATSTEEDDAITYNRAGHIVDWDWPVPSKLWNEGLPHRHVNPVPSLGPPRHGMRSAPGRKALVDSNSLYDAFVTQWCFAQGPSPNPNGYGDGGIMA